MPLAQLADKEKLVYELVCRHFLACCSKDAVGKRTTVKADLGGEAFSASGLMVTARNYLDIYKYDTWNGNIIPVFNVGQRFVPASLAMHDGASCAVLEPLCATTRSSPPSRRRHHHRAAALVGSRPHQPYG